MGSRLFRRIRSDQSRMTTMTTMMMMMKGSRQSDLRYFGRKKPETKKYNTTSEGERFLKRQEKEYKNWSDYFFSDHTMETKNRKWQWYAKPIRRRSNSSKSSSSSSR